MLLPRVAIHSTIIIKEISIFLSPEHVFKIKMSNSGINNPPGSLLSIILYATMFITQQFDI
jgi:hypothetical protein